MAILLRKRVAESIRIGLRRAALVVLVATTCLPTKLGVGLPEEAAHLGRRDVEEGRWALLELLGRAEIREEAVQQ
jgi:hypothetical protein